MTARNVAPAKGTPYSPFCVIIGSKKLAVKVFPLPYSRATSAVLLWAGTAPSG